MEQEILKLINNASRVLIITHVNPDGDTLGCASALKCFIGTKADILIQIKDNFQFPNTYSFLPYINEAKNLSTLEDIYDLVIAVDIASIDRIIDSAREIFNKTENTILIDHHKTNKGFAKINCIKGGISSTGEVLWELFKSLKINVDKNMATGIYAGILTDTGCFKYESTTPETFKIASRLSEIGINTTEIAELCYANKPKNMILFQNYLVSSSKFCINDKIAYTLITKDIVEKFSAKDEYTEGICETLRSIQNVEIAFVLKETETGVKVSIRTKTIDATKITDKFKGGGHKRAAGCTIKAKINNALEQLLKIAKELIEE